MSKRLKYLTIGLLSGLSLVLHTATHAGIVMTGTRVIFPAQQTEKIIQLDNKDHFPNLVQVWLDSGDESSTPETANAPFVVSPPFFKLEAQQGQVLRLIFTGDKTKLATDREHLYYLNFSEMPAIKNTDIDKNKLMVIFKNRLKVFYRPQGISRLPENIAQQLSFSVHTTSAQQSQIRIQNNSPYHANLTQHTLRLKDKEIQKGDNATIAPFSFFDWEINQTLPDLPALELHIILINDYGSAIPYQLKRAPS